MSQAGKDWAKGEAVRALVRINELLGKVIEGKLTPEQAVGEIEKCLGLLRGLESPPPSELGKRKSHLPYSLRRRLRTVIVRNEEMVTALKAWKP